MLKKKRYACSVTFYSGSVGRTLRRANEICMALVAMDDEIKW